MGAGGGGGVGCSPSIPEIKNFFDQNANDSGKTTSEKTKEIQKESRKKGTKPRLSFPNITLRDGPLFFWRGGGGGGGGGG